MYTYIHRYRYMYTLPWNTTRIKNLDQVQLCEHISIRINIYTYKYTSICTWHMYIFINYTYVHTYLYVCTLTWNTTGIKKHFLAGRLLYHAARWHALHLLFHGDYLHVHDGDPQDLLSGIESLGIDSHIIYLYTRTHLYMCTWVYMNYSARYVCICVCVYYCARRHALQLLFDWDEDMRWLRLVGI